MSTKECGHDYCVLNIPRCCKCSDARPHTLSYPRYVDGQGIQQNGTRYEFYCHPCKLYLEALDVNAPLTRWLRRNQDTQESHQNSHTQRPVISNHDPYNLRDFVLVQERAAAWNQRHQEQQSQARARQANLTDRDLQSMRDTIVNSIQDIMREMREVVLESQSSHGQSLTEMSQRSSEYDQRQNLESGFDRLRRRFWPRSGHEIAANSENVSSLRESVSRGHESSGNQQERQPQFLTRHREVPYTIPSRTPLDSSLIIDNACSICFAAHIDAVFVPCSHLIACSECAWRILGSSMLSASPTSCPKATCPVCRSKVTGIIKVYRA